MKIGDILAGLPEGVYQLRLVSAELSQSQAGRPLRVLRWEVATGTYAGKEIRDWLVLTSEGLLRWAQLYVAAGGSREEDVQTVDELARRCLAKLQDGRLVWAEVIQQVAPGGTPRAKIRTYLEPKAGELLAQQYARRDSMVPF